MSENYLAYARKYRPGNFDEIIDQEHIAVTLKNAISRNNLASAYLFSGPRGIGKTSTARILAKALNCKNGPTPEPCDKCTSCVEIREGRSLDVLEIDGASNTGVDNIRDLRENVKFAPSAGRFKIYIIDEVHMLSTSAFNALLKTLEEPPRHVKFIFATTEPQNVLPTVLSRCQRFDFHKISSKSIVQTLKKLSTAEKIKVDEEVLFAVARSADGSLRDAEVILEQLSSFGKGRITLDDVNRVLGLISQDAVLTIAGRLSPESLKDNILLLDRLIGEGKDPAQLAGSLIEHFRNLMLIKCNCEKLVVLPKDDLEKIKKQSTQFGLENILYCIAVLSQIRQRIKKESLGRLFLEMALVKLSRQQELSSNEELLKKIKVLEDALKKNPGAVLPAGGYVSASRTRPVKETPPNYSRAVPAPEQAEAPKAAVKENTVRENTAGQYSSLEEELDSDLPELNLEQVRRLWPHLVKAVKKEKITLGMYLSEGRIVNAGKNRIKLAYSPEFNFHRESLLEQKNLKFIEEMAEKLFGAKIKLDLVVGEPDAADSPVAEDTDVSPQEEEKFESAPIVEEDIDYDEVIQSAIDVFNGRIVQSD